MNKDISTFELLTEAAVELVRSLKGDSFHIVLLKGTLGSGKTTFTKYVGKALGIPEESIQSPTYTVLREYSLDLHPAGLFLHMDLYRIKDIETIEQYGLLELFSQKKGIFFIEWPELLESWLSGFKEHITLLEFQISESSEKRTLSIS